MSAACSAGSDERPLRSARTAPTTSAPTSTTAPSQVTVPRSPVEAALDSIWRETPDGCALVVAGDRVVFARNPDDAVVPASVTKLLTASAALDVLGPATRFNTHVRADLDTDGVVVGDLWVVGDRASAVKSSCPRKYRLGGRVASGERREWRALGRQARLHTTPTVVAWDP